MTGHTVPGIRPVSPSDATVLARLHAVSFDRPWGAAGLRDLIADPVCAGWCAAMTAAGEADGFILVRIAADEAEILTLAVDPPRRRCGIATALLRRVATEAGRRGVRTMFLEVAPGNEAALALYQAFGFRQVGRRPAYYRAGTSGDALILSRAVDARVDADRVDS